MKGSDRRSPVGQVGLPWVSKVLPAEGDGLSVCLEQSPSEGRQGTVPACPGWGPCPHGHSAEELWPQVLLDYASPYGVGCGTGAW